MEWGTSMFAIFVYFWYRPGRKRWIAAASIASLAVTGIDLVYDQGVRGVGTAEVAALGLLMLFAVRHWDAAPGRWVAYSTGAAIMLIGPARIFYNQTQDAAAGGTILIFMAMTTVIGFGAYLRSLDKLRRETQERSARPSASSWRGRCTTSSRTT